MQQPNQWEINASNGSTLVGFSDAKVEGSTYSNIFGPKPAMIVVDTFTDYGLNKDLIQKVWPETRVVPQIKIVNGDSMCTKNIIFLHVHDRKYITSEGETAWGREQ